MFDSLFRMKTQRLNETIQGKKKNNFQKKGHVFSLIVQCYCQGAQQTDLHHF